LTRDAHNPRNVELNDVLGNYSLTLIDSLSTLAILASAPPDSRDTGPKALRDFQSGVEALVQQYGDGRPGRSGHGLRGRGFDVDSKVQVFETVIRGVGGLLSAHLFAIGELPITGYDPRRYTDEPLDVRPITWPNGFKYDGQLLRLALDLAQRLLPAFYTTTGMPYPRVNLRHGIPFYVNSPLHEASGSTAGTEGPPEITETCSAGAGSLVLEFTVLSRLTGDPRFEQLAKRAFWAVWHRKSRIGLIGAGVDAEDGQWIGAYSVIGAGADSFFEYALKTHILLSGHDLPNRTWTRAGRNDNWLDPNTIYPPLSDDENSSDSFLEAWHLAHAAIKRHLYNDREHPHYINVNLWTGSFASNWIDSLGAYYSGLLSLAGELDEAIETNLLYTAIWTKYSALPERWSLKDKTVEGGLGWWPLRPEFIESVYHLYRATKDPWYLYVGEMVLRDITRRCWTPCGWAGLQNVLSGEKSDRMESFFLGETAKYMYLLYDDGHPLNSLDASYVFTTEGHPLIIPRKRQGRKGPRRTPKIKELVVPLEEDNNFTMACPLPPQPQALGGSATAARPDLFHAARLLDLHLLPTLGDDFTASDASRAPGQLVALANHTFFPWTLPTDLLPNDGVCSKVYQPLEITLEFASNPQQPEGGSNFNFMLAAQNMERLAPDRIRLNSLSGLKVVMRLDESAESEWRLTKVNGIPLGRDEVIVMKRSILGEISDQRFNLVRDQQILRLQHLHRIDLSQAKADAEDIPAGEEEYSDGVEFEDQSALLEAIKAANQSTGSRVTEFGSLVKSLLSRMAASLDIQLPAPPTPLPESIVISLPYNLVVNQTAVTPTGLGAAPLPDVDIPATAHIPILGAIPEGLFPWTTVYAAGSACDGPIPEEAARDHHVVVLRRGGCSFSAKLANIPAHVPSERSVRLVVVVSDGADGEGRGAATATRPLLDEVQRTPSGIERRHLIPMVMVGGGDVAYHQLAMAERVGIARKYYIESQGVRVANIIVDDGEVGADA